jgi:hypothetical protein
MEEALAKVNVDNLTPEEVQAFLDLPDGGVTEVGPYKDAVVTNYFGEYSSSAKSFLITGGRNDTFKEFAGFYAQWMLLQSNPTTVTKVRNSIIIAIWENRHMDWAALTSVPLIREAIASRKNQTTALAYWLGCSTPQLRARKGPTAGRRTRSGCQRRKRNGPGDNTNRPRTRP